MAADLNKDIEKSYDMLHQANLDVFYVWKNTIVFTWRWWILIGIIVFCWGFWIIWRDKTNTDKLLLAGLFAALASSLMDTIGMAMGLWSYSTKSVPLIPPHLVWDLCAIPVITMVFIQYKPEFSPIIKSLLLAAFGSFGMQPVATWLGLYNPKNWEHYYSFPLVIIIYLIANSLYQGKTWEHPCDTAKRGNGN